jgi:catechol 2,3-dioxygenase-like lactoylglutathione lyase family enzyme
VEQAKLAMNHVAIRVRSLEASRGFYAALLPLLGFEPRGETRWDDPQGFHFLLAEAEEGSHGYDRFAPGVNHLGFAAPALESVQAIREAMLTAGFAAPEIRQLSGASALFLADPDGLRLEVTHYPPGWNDAQ